MNNDEFVSSSMAGIEQVTERPAPTPRPERIVPQEKPATSFVRSEPIRVTTGYAYHPFGAEAWQTFFKENPGACGRAYGEVGSRTICTLKYGHNENHDGNYPYDPKKED